MKLKHRDNNTATPNTHRCTLQMRKHFWLDQVKRMNSLTPAQMALRLSTNILKLQHTPTGWRRS